MPFLNGGAQERGWRASSGERAGHSSVLEKQPNFARPGD